MSVSAVFLKLLNMSIAANWLIIAVIIARLLLKRAPMWISCILWALVGFRLICPFSIKSALSLVPSAETVNTTHYTARPYIQSGVDAIDNAANGYLGSHYFEGVTVPSQDSVLNPVNVISVIWLIGVAAMLLYMLISFFRLKKSIGASVSVKDNIFVCDEVKSPFILGIFNPHIYLPSDLNTVTAEYVLTHEKAHISRGDHLWKPLGFLIISVYWFNPLCWVSFILFCRDIETASDEKVIKNKDNNYKAAYSQALLTCSLPKKMISASPLAFGEVGVKGRVKAVLNYKKPAFWVVIAAVLVCIAIAFCFLTNPVSETGTDNIEQGSNVSSHNNSGDNSVSTTEYSIITSEYKYKNNYDDAASLSLNTETKEFTFSYSLLSSYYAAGTYEETESGILLKTDDGKNHYAFIKSENAYIFDAENSSSLPQYSYSSDAEPVVCVPDGAVFQLSVYSPIFDKTDFDIDGDGKNETCVLTYGPSYGVFSFFFSIYKDGNAIYNELFWSTPCIEGFKVDNGKLKLQGNSADNSDESVLYDISIKDGHIFIGNKDTDYVFPTGELVTD